MSEVMKTRQEIETSVFEYMAEKKKNSERPTANDVILMLEAEQNSSLTTMQKKFVHLAITKWLKENNNHPAPKVRTVEPKVRPQISQKFMFRLSPELAAVLGKEVMSGHRIRHELRKIILKDGLRNPRNFSEILTSEKFMPIFKVPKFKLDQMMSYLGDHMTSLEECKQNE